MRLVALCFLAMLALFLFAKDVDPGGPGGNAGYLQIENECLKTCYQQEFPDGTILVIYAPGMVRSCDSGSAPSCMLQVCDAECN